jgi:hypothetical protein
VNAKLLSALMGLIAIVFLNVASAAAFNVQVRGHVTRSQAACPDGAALCGTAYIEGYGDAEFRWFQIAGDDPSGSCGPLSGFLDYGAIVTLTLSDGSVLTLYEVGTQCTPGGSFPTGGPKSYGNPRFFVADWQVVSAAGQFAGLTGSGTSSGKIAGAGIVSRYGGALNEGSNLATVRVNWDITVNGEPRTCEEVGASQFVVNLSGIGSTELAFDCGQKSAEFVVDAGVYTVAIDLVDVAGNRLSSVPIVQTFLVFPGQVYNLGSFQFAFGL